MSLTRTAKRFTRHKLNRQTKRPNAQSIEAVSDLVTLLQGYADLLPDRHRPKLLAYLDAVTAWAGERRRRRIEDNLNLVWKDVQNHYHIALESSSVPPDDAFQEGCIGLMRAADLFDESMGFEFSTYAVRWIRQNISRMLVRSYVIHIPEHLLRSPKGRKTYMKEAEKVQKVMSLDLPLPGEDSAFLGNTVPDPSSLREGEEMTATLDLPEFLAGLNEFDKELLRLRYMVGMTLEEVAAELHRTGIHQRVSRERVRQLTWRAIKRARQWCQNKGISDVV